MQCLRNQDLEPGGTGLLSWQLSGRKDASHHEAVVSSAPYLRHLTCHRDFVFSYHSRDALLLESVAFLFPA